MSVKILSVSVTPSITTVGQPISVLIAAEEIEWSNLKNDFVSWGEVKHSFTNWNKVLNYQYSKAVADANAVCTVDNYALFGSDGSQISLAGGYTSQYSAEDINHFLREVLDG